MKKLNCYKTVKWILSALPFFLYIWTPTCLCAIQRFHRAACAGTVQIWKGLGFPNKHFATQNSRCIYVCPACGYNVIDETKIVSSKTVIWLCRFPQNSNIEVLTGAKRFIFLTPYSLASFCERFQVSDLIHTMPWHRRIGSEFYFASLYTTHGLRGWVTWTTSP